MNDNDNKKMLLLKTGDKFLVNDKFECTVIDEKPFNVFEKSNVCPSYTTTALISIKDYNGLAKLHIMLHPDLIVEFSSMIYFYTNVLDKPCTSVIITDIKQI